MTAGKAAPLTTAFVGVFAVGVAVGPSLRDRLSSEHTPMAAPSVETAEAIASPLAASTARTTAPRAKATTAPRKLAPSGAVTLNSASNLVVPVSEPRLQARLKPVLNRGARMDVAAEG